MTALNQAQSQALIDASMALVAEKGWRSVSLAQMLSAADLTYAEVFPHLRDKQGVLALLADQVDQAMLAEAEDFDPETPVREHLFDLIMARFDALDDYKQAAAKIQADLTSSPLEALTSGTRLQASMEAALNAAGEDTAGILGNLRAKALAAVYLRVLQVWLKDESEDLGATMKALDENLGHAEEAANFVARGPDLKGFDFSKWRKQADPADGASGTEAPIQEAANV